MAKSTCPRAPGTRDGPLHRLIQGAISRDVNRDKGTHPSARDLQQLKAPISQESGTWREEAVMSVWKELGPWEGTA